MKYCFHLPLPKASQCFILDWLHYKRISVKHFAVTPLWCRFGFKARASGRAPAGGAWRFPSLAGSLSGVRFACAGLFLTLVPNPTVSLAIASRFDFCARFIKSFLESSFWALFFANGQLCLKTPLLGVAHLNMTFPPSLFQDGSETGVTKEDALVDDWNWAKSFVSKQTLKGLCQIKWEGVSPPAPAFFSA